MAETFRRNVAALVQVGDAYLACLRQDLGTWQCVQGGLESSDDSVEAGILRELQEELGADPACFQILHRSRTWRRYRFPADILRRERAKGGHTGQDQLWFHVRCTNLAACDLSRSHGEFSELSVRSIEDLLAGYAPWKRAALWDFCLELGIPLKLSKGGI